jgi:hypothetical protein
MAASEIQAEMEESLYSEICRVWEQFRIANLNVRYYGSLAQRTKFRNSALQIAIAVCSLIALVILAAPELRNQFAIVAVITSGLATVIAGALPFLGWDEDARKYSFLNRAYQLVENQIRDTLVQMRRSNTLTPQLLGKSEMVLDSMFRLQGLDEEEYSKRALAEKGALTEEVNHSFPADYVWNNL